MGNNRSCSLGLSRAKPNDLNASFDLRGARSQACVQRGLLPLVQQQRQGQAATVRLLRAPIDEADGLIAAAITNGSLATGNYLDSLPRLPPGVPFGVDGRSWAVYGIAFPEQSIATVWSGLLEHLESLQPTLTILQLSPLQHSSAGSREHEEFLEEYQKIVTKLTDLGAIVVACTTACSERSLSEAHYLALQSLHIASMDWGIPCIHLMGALDDGSGGVPPDYLTADNLLNEAGEALLCGALVPSLFVALMHNVPVPQRLPPPQQAGMAILPEGLSVQCEVARYSIHVVP